MTLMTRELLEQGRSCTNGFSRAQMDLVGVETRPPVDMVRGHFIPKKWWLNVIGKDYPDEVIAKFIALKDKHLTPRQIEAYIKRSIKNEELRAAARAERAAKAPPPPTPLPDGMWDVENRSRREIWEAGKMIKWHLKRNVKNWGAYPDAPLQGEAA